MVHTLRVIRSEMDSILAAMSIFVVEPSLDWLDHAVRHQSNKNAAIDSISWSPRRVWDCCRDKLNGAHPSEMTCRDLQNNAHFSTINNQDGDMLTYLSDLVRGIASGGSLNKRSLSQGSFRIDFPSGGLSVEQQV